MISIIPYPLDEPALRRSGVHRAHIGAGSCINRDVVVSLMDFVYLLLHINEKRHHTL